MGTHEDLGPAAHGIRMVRCIASNVSFYDDGKVACPGCKLTGDKFAPPRPKPWLVNEIRRGEIRDNATSEPGDVPPHANEMVYQLIARNHWDYDWLVRIVGPTSSTYMGREFGVMENWRSEVVPDWQLNEMRDAKHVERPRAMTFARGVFDMSPPSEELVRDVERQLAELGSASAYLRRPIEPKAEVSDAAAAMAAAVAELDAKENTELRLYYEAIAKWMSDRCETIEKCKRDVAGVMTDDFRARIRKMWFGSSDDWPAPPTVYQPIDDGRMLTESEISAEQLRLDVERKAPALFPEWSRAPRSQSHSITAGFGAWETRGDAKLEAEAKPYPYVSDEDLLPDA